MVDGDEVCKAQQAGFPPEDVGKLRGVPANDHRSHIWTIGLGLVK